MKRFKRTEAEQVLMDELEQREMTLTELAEEMGMARSTVRYKQVHGTWSVREKEKLSRVLGPNRAERVVEASILQAEKDES